MKEVIPVEEKEKGYISNQYTVWCGLCVEWYQESSPTKSWAIKEFKRLGWKLTTANGWICPNHKDVK